MTHAQAYEAARSWIDEFGRTTAGYAGAYLSGSFLEHAPEAEWPADSDVDVVILCREDPVPQAGKFVNGVLSSVLAQRDQEEEKH